MENKLNQVSFIVPGKITSKGRPRARVIKSGSKGGGSYASIYTPQDTIIYENLIKMCYKEQANNYHFGNSPLSVSIYASFQSPKEVRDLRALGYGYIACFGRQDLDNIAKIVLDALNKIAFFDDKQITDLRIMKMYDKQERLEINIYRLSNLSLAEAKELKRADNIKKARIKKLKKEQRILTERIARLLNYENQTPKRKQDLQLNIDKLNIVEQELKKEE
jgi:Holliday junction resolvase RusA-like endonuclease